MEAVSDPQNIRQIVVAERQMGIVHLSIPHKRETSHPVIVVAHLQVVAVPVIIHRQDKSGVLSEIHVHI